MDMSTPVFLHGYSGDAESLREFAALCFPDSQPVCIELPGFGESRLVDRSAETDASKYIDEVWAIVRRTVPQGKIHLVGHSYGAVLAFALAAEHEDSISGVDLFTPGVFPKFVPKVCLLLVSTSRFIPGGTRLFTWIMRRQFAVDIVTWTMENKSWPEAKKKQIRAIRRKESQANSVQMVLLSLHTLHMPRLLQPVQCTVPVRVVHATDDTVTRYESCEWLAERSKDIAIVATYGGHLGLVAEPDRWARLLYDKK